jgi:hypothetical protein
MIGVSKAIQITYIRQFAQLNLYYGVMQNVIR